MHHVVEGRGPVVVLSHALGCSLSMWDEVSARLRERWTVVRYDQPGHGASPGVGASLEDFADAAAALLRRCGPAHFVGLSMGGMVAQSLAARQPGLVRSLAIANSCAFYGEAARAMWRARVDTVRAQGMEAIADGALQRWFTPAFRQGAGAARVAAMRAELIATDAEAYARSCEAVAAIDFRASNARIAVPTLVIAGARDEATPPALSAEIHAAIPGAARVDLDAAHLSAVEQPDAFVAALEGFWR